MKNFCIKLRFYSDNFEYLEGFQRFTSRSIIELFKLNHSQYLRYKIFIYEDNYVLSDLLSVSPCLRIRSVAEFIRILRSYRLIASINYLNNFNHGKEK